MTWTGTRSLSNANPPRLKNGWADVGPPGSEDLAGASSGGGRRPEIDQINNWHRDAPPLWNVGRELYHSPVNSAFRFSPNALMPSFASFDTKTRLMASRSMAR